MKIALAAASAALLLSGGVASAQTAHGQNIGGLWPPYEYLADGGMMYLGGYAGIRYENRCNGAMACVDPSTIAVAYAAFRAATPGQLNGHTVPGQTDLLLRGGVPACIVYVQPGLPHWYAVLVTKLPLAQCAGMPLTAAGGAVPAGTVERLMVTFGTEPMR